MVRKEAGTLSVTPEIVTETKMESEHLASTLALYHLCKGQVRLLPNQADHKGLITGYPRHRENRENGKKKSLSGKTQGIWKFCQNTGNFVHSCCKFPKGKRYCDICRENFHFFPEAEKFCQHGFVYVIVTNYVNWLRGNLRLDRENTGN